MSTAKKTHGAARDFLPKPAVVHFNGFTQLLTELVLIYACNSPHAWLIKYVFQLALNLWRLGLFSSKSGLKLFFSLPYLLLNGTVLIIIRLYPHLLSAELVMISCIYLREHKY